MLILDTNIETLEYREDRFKFLKSVHKWINSEKKLHKLAHVQLLHNIFMLNYSCE